MTTADKIESGIWQTIKGEEPLPTGVSSEFTITLRFDGSISLHTRSAESRAVDDLVADMEKARDSLTLQLEQRFTRCPLFVERNVAGELMKGRGDD